MFKSDAFLEDKANMTQLIIFIISMDNRSNSLNNTWSAWLNEDSFILFYLPKSLIIIEIRKKLSWKPFIWTMLWCLSVLERDDPRHPQQKLLVKSCSMLDYYKFGQRKVSWSLPPLFTTFQAVVSRSQAVWCWRQRWWSFELVIPS